MEKAKFDSIVSAVYDLVGDTLMNIYNSMIKSENGTQYIYRYGELNDVLAGMTPIQIIETLSSDFDKQDEYFYFDRLGCLASEDDVEIIIKYMGQDAKFAEYVTKNLDGIFRSLGINEGVIFINELRDEFSSWVLDNHPENKWVYEYADKTTVNEILSLTWQELYDKINSENDKPIYD